VNFFLLMGFYLQLNISCVSSGEGGLLGWPTSPSWPTTRSARVYLFTIFLACTLVRLARGLYMINPFLHSLTLYCILQVKLIHQLIYSIELLLYLLEAFPHTTDNVCPLDIPSTRPSSSTHTVRAVSHTSIPHSAKLSSTPPIAP